MEFLNNAKNTWQVYRLKDNLLIHEYISETQLDIYSDIEKYKHVQMLEEEELKGYSNWLQREGIFDLNVVKEQFYKIVDNKTDQLILNGFYFNGIKFGLTQTDQMNYTGLLIKKDILTYPYKMKGFDNTIFYEFDSAIEIENFSNTVFLNVNQILNIGWEIKEQIQNCSTIEEILLIEDNR